MARWGAGRKGIYRDTCLILVDGDRSNTVTLVIYLLDLTVPLSLESRVNGDMNIMIIHMMGSCPLCSRAL